MHSDGTMMYICTVGGTPANFIKNFAIIRWPAKDTLTMASICSSRNNQIYNFKEAATNKTLLK